MASTQRKSTSVHPRQTKASLLRSNQPGSTTSATNQPASEKPKKPTSTTKASDGVRAFMAQQRARMVTTKPMPVEEPAPAKKRVLTGVDRYTSGPKSTRPEAFGLDTVPQTPLALKSLIQRAKTSGKIDLSGKHLEQLPEEVLTMYHVDTKNYVVDFSNPGQDAWYDCEEFTKLIVADNNLKFLDDRVGTEFGTLKLLDARHNQLSSLPTTLSQLDHLTTLHLDYNQFTVVPPCLYEIRGLRQLVLTHNQIDKLDEDIGQLTELHSLDISYNQVMVLPEALWTLPHLQVLDASHNKLSELPPLNLLSSTKLAQLSLAHNRFSHVFRVSEIQEPIELTFLEQLDCSDNRLDSLVLFENDDRQPPQLFPKLKKLALARNRLSNLALRGCAPNIEILDIGSNNISELPRDVFELTGLRSIDISLNNLRHLPPELGALDQLEHIYWEGNPLRSVSKRMTMSELMESLREQLTLQDASPSEDTLPSSTPQNKQGLPTQEQSERPPSAPTKAKSSFEIASNTSSTLPSPADPHHEKRRVTREWMGKQLEEVTEDMLKSDHEAITKLILCNNKLKSLPAALSVCANQLVTLDLSRNRLSDLSVLNFSLPSLRTLDVSLNAIKSVEKTDAFPRLEELNLSSNQIQSVPEDLIDFLPRLRVLNLNSNKITTISACSFRQLRVLDLANNDITQVPPELGLVDSLEELHLYGNRFRVPRPSLLDQGTKAVMEYLRSRVP